MGKQRFINRYMWLVVAAGTAMFVLSAVNLPFARLDFRFGLLFLLTVVISSRIAIKVPRVNTTITVADSFVFLTLLLYGPEAAVIVAAADGLSAGFHLSKRWITVLFNAAAAALALSSLGYQYCRWQFSQARSISSRESKSAFLSFVSAAFRADSAAS